LLGIAGATPAVPLLLSISAARGGDRRQVLGQLFLNKVQKFYGDFEVLKGIDLEVKDGEFVIFVGPSGCGKSTLLRIIAGLEDATSGSRQIDGSGSITCRRPSAASPWCSSPTRSIRT
jgi:ABC-type polysaccharide/polyol phosphate transport system ATPase subunit